MKPDIHPQYKDVKVICSCGNTFITRSTSERDSISLEVCSVCHPFYTGTQKIVDTAGRVDRFRQKYGMKGKEAAAKVESKEEVKAAPKVEAKPEQKTEAKVQGKSEKKAESKAKKDKDKAK